MQFIKNWVVQTYLFSLKIPRSLLRFAYKKHKNKTAIISNGTTMTYDDIATVVLSLSNGLLASGITQGDSVLVMVPNGLQQVQISLMGYESGIVLTNLHADRNVSDIGEIVTQIEPKLFIYADEIAADISRFLRDNYPLIKQLETNSTYMEMIGNYSPKKVDIKIKPQDIATLGFTSGTTGKPKALPTSHGAIIKSLQLIVKNVGISKHKKHDVFLVAIPLTGAGSGVVLPALASGSTLVIPNNFEVAEILDLIEKHGVTRIFLTPSTLIDILDLPTRNEYNLGSLENIIYGTESMPAAKLKEAIAVFGPILQQGYGSAEVLPPVSMLHPMDHLVNGEIANDRILTSVGSVVPQVSVKIVDQNQQELPVGRIGEVMIKSPTLFNGYYKNPDLNAKTLIDGWLKIGDVGYLSEDNRLYVLGRKSDLIFVDGQTVYPRYTEEIVHEHPKVKECVLVRVNSKTILALSIRQQYAASISDKELKMELIGFLKNSGLNSAQIPDEIVIFKELPRSYLAKVLRKEVRNTLAQNDNVPKTD